MDFLLNWKTTLAGIVAGFLLALVQYYQAGGVVTWEVAVSFLAAAAVGYLSKDANKTGTKGAPRA